MRKGGDGQRLDFIDSLRGWAVFGVIIVHANALIFDKIPGSLQALSSSGARGVQLFFMLSAFSLFYSLQKRIENNRPERIISFVLRRYFRIAPMFYVAIIIYSIGIFYILYPSIYPKIQYSVGNIISHLTFIHGVWPNYVNSLVPGGWSIAVEMTFYMFVPLLFAKIKTLSDAIWFLVISAIAFIAMSQIGSGPSLFSTTVWADFIFFLLPSQLLAFAFGIILYMLYRKESLHHGDKPSNILRYANQLLALGFVCAIVMYMNGQYKGVLFSLPMFLVAWSLSIKPRKFFVNKYMSFFGKISFSVYLLHFIIIPLVSSYVLLAIPEPLSRIEASVIYIEIIALTVILVTPLAYFTYRYIERPGISLGEHVVRMIPRKPTV